MGSRIALLDIVDLIVELRERMNKYADLLQGNEALTRYALIDSLLRALGWNTEDPDQVIPEFSTPNNDRIDYVLKMRTGAGDEKKIVIEAKSLGTQWDSEVVTKVLMYAIKVGAKIAVITDGNRWEIYDVTREAELDKKLILAWQIKEGTPSDVALKVLAIANLGDPGTLGKPGYKPLLLPEEASSEKKQTGGSGKVNGPFTTRLAEKMVLQVLADASRPLNRKEIANEVRKRVNLTEHDIEKVKSGLSRWMAMVYWAISGLYKKGYLAKAGENSYVITSKGRKRLSKL